MLEEKTCTKCSQTKTIDQFYIQNKKYRSGACKKCFCDSAKGYYHNKNKDRVREDKLINPTKYSDRREIIKKRNLGWLLSFMDTDVLKCERCQYSGSFVAMQMHHLDPSQKNGYKDTLGYWIQNLSLKVFQKKITETRFIIVCANCHFELHEGIWKYGE